MPRFVILEHDHPHRHWDFMMEEGGVLTTWRLPQPPRQAELRLEAEAIGDHRLAYLDYEGPVSGCRGSVTRWDAGTYAVMEGDEKDRRILRLQGRRCAGIVVLEKRSAAAWMLSYSPETMAET